MGSTLRSAVELRRCSIKFSGHGGDVLALDDVSFSVSDAEFVSIVGPSGCGKSTTLRLLAGLCRPSSGDVLVREQEVQGPPDGLWMMFQSAVLLDWFDVLRNVSLPLQVAGVPKKEAQQRARVLLDRTGLSRFAGSYPHELSGGMQQRVALCRSLVARPNILLMDEPFAALDAITRDQLVRELEDLWMRERMSVVFVTHSIPEAVTLSDRVFVMSPRPGRISKEIALDLPRPRDRVVQSSAPFQEQVRAITDEIESQLDAAPIELGK